MKDFAKVSLMGHLGADVEFRQTPSGKNVANFPLATNRNTLDADGKKVEKVDYHKIVAWGKSAEHVQKYLSKGAHVLVDGRLVNSSFDDNDGHKQFKTEVVLDDVYFLDKKPVEA